MLRGEGGRCMGQTARFQETLRKLAMIDEGFVEDEAGLGLGQVATCAKRQSVSGAGLPGLTRSSSSHRDDGTRPATKWTDADGGGGAWARQRDSTRFQETLRRSR